MSCSIIDTNSCTVNENRRAPIACHSFVEFSCFPEGDALPLQQQQDLRGRIRLWTDKPCKHEATIQGTTAEIWSLKASRYR